MSNSEELEAKRIIEAMGTSQDIRGSIWNITMTFENDYKMKASGELQPHAVFLVYKKSMTKWEPPHENELVNDAIIQAIIKEIDKTKGPGKVDIRFV